MVLDFIIDSTFLSLSHTLSVFYSPNNFIITGFYGNLGVRFNTPITWPLLKVW